MPLIAHDAAFAESLRAELELRFHQRRDVAVRSQQRRPARQQQGKRDETRIAYDEVETRVRKMRAQRGGVQMAGVDAFQCNAVIAPDQP